MTDLNFLIPEETFTFEVKHPIKNTVLLDADEKPMTVTVYSPYSDKFKQIAHKQAKKRISRTKEDKEVTYSELEDFALDMMAESVPALSVVFDGKVVEHSTENVKSLFKKLPWLLEQVKEAQDNAENFFKN